MLDFLNNPIVADIINAPGRSASFNRWLTL